MLCLSISNKFATYTFPYVVLSPTIRLVYDLIDLFPLFYLQQESKERKKLKLNFIIYLAHDYKDRSLSKLSKRKDRTKLLFI